jgi:hypothetical protein
MHIRNSLPVGSVCRHPCYSRTRPCLRARPSTTQSRPQSKPSRPSVASAVADYEQRFNIKTRPVAGMVRQAGLSRRRVNSPVQLRNRLYEDQKKKGVSLCSRALCPKALPARPCSRASRKGDSGTCMLGAPARRMSARSAGRAHTCPVGRKVGELGTKRKYYSDHPSGGPPDHRPVWGLRMHLVPPSRFKRSRS